MSYPHKAVKGGVAHGRGIAATSRRESSGFIGWHVARSNYGRNEWASGGAGSRGQSTQQATCSHSARPPVDLRGDADPLDM